MLGAWSAIAAQKFLADSSISLISWGVSLVELAFWLESDEDSAFFDLHISLSL